MSKHSTSSAMWEATRRVHVSLALSQILSSMTGGQKVWEGNGRNLRETSATETENGKLLASFEHRNDMTAKKKLMVGNIAKKKLMVGKRTRREKS